MKACSSNADIFINGEKIEIVTKFNYLGLTLDSNLSFKKHVKKLVRTIKYSLINFRQIRQCLPIDIARIFMHATIFSHLSYCLTCWGQAGETIIKPLKSLYKQTLKTLDKKSNQYHHCRVLEKYNFLSFDNFRLFRNLCMVYKMLNGLAPSILGDFVHFRSTVSARFTRSSSTSDRVIPFCDARCFWIMVFLSESHHMLGLYRKT